MEKLSKYYDEWKSRDDVEKEYGKDTPAERSIIYAGYTWDGCSGNALVVFLALGHLFENNDSHCSCNGLETWSPERTTLGALLKRQGWPGLREALAKRFKSARSSEDRAARS